MGIILAVPIILFLLLATLLYTPAVQEWAVGKVTEHLAATTGTQVKIGKVRLAFPLDLALHQAEATDGGDTLLIAKAIRLNVMLLPLFSGNIEIDGAEIFSAKVNTKDFISDVNVKGTIGTFHLASHGVSLKDQTACINSVSLEKSDIAVILSDTAKKDTAKTPVNWKILVKKADIASSKISLKMPGDSMRIAASIGLLKMKDGSFDLGKKDYSVSRLALSESRADYDIPYEKNKKGIDFNHLSFSYLRTLLSDFSYRNGKLKIDVSEFALSENSGLRISKMKGKLTYDSLGIVLPDFSLSTPTSSLTAKANIQMKAFASGGDGKIRIEIDGRISKKDIMLAVPALPLSVRKSIPDKPLYIKTEVEGNVSNLNLRSFELSVPGVCSLQAHGHMAKLKSEPERNGQILYSIKAKNLDFVSALTGGSLSIIPATSVSGAIGFNGNRYAIKIKGNVGGGKINALGRYSMKGDVYSASVNVDKIPLGSLIKGKGLSDFSGDLSIEGRGFNFFSRNTNLNATVKIRDLQYDSIMLGNVSLEAKLLGQKAALNFAADNDLVDGKGSLEVISRGKMYSANLSTDISRLDLKTFSDSADSLQLSFSLNSEAFVSRSGESYGFDGGITNIKIIHPSGSHPAKNLLLSANITPASSQARLVSGDMNVRFAAGSNPEKLSAQIMRFITHISALKKERRVALNDVKKYLPETQLFIESGKENPVCNFLRFLGYSYDRMLVDISTGKDRGINGKMQIYRLNTGALRLDTTDVVVSQDSAGMELVADIRNKEKDNPYIFTTHLRGYLLERGIGLEMVFKDKDNREGVNLGLRADMENGGLRFRVYPKKPVLAFRRFEINDSNFIFLGKNKTIRADVNLTADDGTGLKIYSLPTDSVEDLAISINRLNLRELSAVVPYLPQIGGLLSGDVHIIKKNEYLTFKSSLNVKDMTYEKSPLGDIGLEALYLPKTKTEHFINATVLSQGSEVMKVDGIYREALTEERINAICRLTHFPLSMANGFVPEGMVSLQGYGDGVLNIGGTADAPLINGEIMTDSAYLASKPYGINLKMDSKKISVSDNNLAFDDFAFYSTGREPLLVNGTVDFKDISKMKLDLEMKAKNFELINAEKNAQSLVYGKVYADFDASLRGDLSRMLVMRGKMNVLDRTDVAYILKDSPLSVDDRLSDLVKFVNFSDTTKIETSAPDLLGLNMLLNINVSDAARVHCDLSSDAQSYIDIEGGGNLTMKYTPQGELSLVGRYTVNSGEMKYALPVIPLKTFSLTNGSSISFTGDAFNPTLNITAKERVKASVTDDNNSRSVAFDVGVSITKPLNQMGLEFTLEAPEDLTVQNQLAAMSREQRGKLAVSMLATGMYLAETNSTAFNANNALNSFLQSEIQNIAGNALKTIDLSVGLEDGTNADGTSHTDYSFRFAKRFWGNRVSIIIGGKVSTGSNDGESQTQSFIDNVSLEYRLDKSSSRYVRVFYDRDSQDPLEGQITTTGAGLVLRKKTNNLGELFIFRKAKKKDGGSNKNK